MVTLGEKLRMLRIQNNITQEGVAKILEVDRSTVASWEIGRREPDCSTLSRLIKLYNSSANYFFSETDDLNPDNTIIIPDIPVDIYNFITDNNNQNLIRAIQQMQSQGYSNKLILDWIISLKKTFETINQKHDIETKSDQILWIDEDLLSESHQGKYNEEQKKAIVEELNKKLNEPDFIPPWKKQND